MCAHGTRRPDAVKEVGIRVDERVRKRCERPDILTQHTQALRCDPGSRLLTEGTSAQTGCSGLEQPPGTIQKGVIANEEYLT